MLVATASARWQFERKLAQRGGSPKYVRRAALQLDDGRPGKAGTSSEATSQASA
jgi:hypothetical protein